MQDVGFTEKYRRILENPNHWFEVSLAIGESGLLTDHRGDYLVFGSGGGSTRILVDTGGADGGFGESMLISMSITSKLFADDIPQCGCAVASEIDVEMIAPLTEIPRKARVVPYVRATDGVEYSQWIQKGVFFIDTRETTVGIGGENVLKFHGFDAMVLTDADYPNIVRTDDVPYDDAQAIQDIATALNVGVDSRTWDIVNQHYQFGIPIGYSMREVLQQIASAYCGNFIISDDGQLRLVRINEMPAETNLLTDELGNRFVFGEGDPEPDNIRVENIGTYGFELNEDGYYESQNFGVHNSYSLCKLHFETYSEATLVLKCINYAENGFDYGVIGNIDTNLSSSITDATSDIFYRFPSPSSPEVQTIEIPIESEGEHFVSIKFRKDGSMNRFNDSLQFKWEFKVREAVRIRV